jgi:hypothetical protein
MGNSPELAWWDNAALEAICELKTLGRLGKLFLRDEILLKSSIYAWASASYENLTRLLSGWVPNGMSLELLHVSGNLIAVPNGSEGYLVFPVLTLPSLRVIDNALCVGGLPGFRICTKLLEDMETGKPVEQVRIGT